MIEAQQNEKMDLPQALELPFFVYGALKPGMPAFEQLRPLVEVPFQSIEAKDCILYVRDGLPLLKRTAGYSVHGFLLRWLPGKGTDAYDVVCKFEPRKHYEWSEVTLQSGIQANTLIIRYPDKGNPQPLEYSSWRLSNDPAFGPGLDAVEDMLKEVDLMPTGDFDKNWQRFFRSQMAYLLLWSILERLSAFCFGPGQDPMQRIKRLHKLRGMSEAVKDHVHRSDCVSDSRNPDSTYRLDGTNAKGSFNYYYQVRSNLSHRGKAMFSEFEKVQSSLKELLAITRQYLVRLQEQEKQL